MTRDAHGSGIVGGGAGRLRLIGAVASVLLLSRVAPGAEPAATLGEAVSLRGTIDLHCHSGPDTVARALNDLQLGRLAGAAGMRAIVLKNHHTMTADRAELAFRESGGVEIFGGIVLNRSVGGLNAEAVRRMAEMEGRRGRIVWLPTLDAENQVRFANDNRPAVAVVHDGKVVPELGAIFELVARHDLVLATGHSSADESLVIIPAAKAAGVKRFLVTHVLAEAIRATPGKLRELAELGAMLECTWLTHAPGAGGAINVGRPVPVADGVRLIRAVGADHVVISSDLGQQNNPPPPDGLRAYMVALHAAGLTAHELDLVARRNPARLLGLAP